ncbi:MAG: hypothetical protein UE329_01930, partial [Lachnospiraceae bacterium]|nr:hypothetical protein [Lachnospiraceae bacterium]
MSEKPCGAYFFAFFENFFVPILTSGGLAAVSSSFFAALCSAFGRYDGIEVTSICTASPKLFDDVHLVTDDYKKMLDEVDAVYIVSPPTQHY